jgi:enoyl-CoA hydratase
MRSKVGGPRQVESYSPDVLAVDAGVAVELERVPLGTPGTAAAILWLNRPGQLNAINGEMLTQLETSLAEADDDATVRAVLITGRGSAFSSGGDLKGYLSLQQDAAAFQAFVDHFQRTMSSIRLMTKPVIALVNGVTAAGGLELLLACDFAYAAQSARIGDAHLNYGQMGGGGSLTLLPRLIGPARARELFFSARLLSAADACDWGLVNRVLPDVELLRAGVDFAAALASKSALAVANAKYVMNVGLADGTGVEAALRLERERTALYILTAPDSMEGLRAFAEGRKPVDPAS